MPDPLDAPPYATNKGPGSGPPDLQNREWLGRAGITDKLVQGLSTLFAPIAALAGKANAADVVPNLRKRQDSMFGGMSWNEMASDGRYWRLGVVKYWPGTGRFSLYNSRGYGHYEDKDRVFTQRDSYDFMKSWGPEFIIKAPDGYDKYADTSGDLATGDFAIVSMRRAIRPSTGDYDDYFAPILFIIKEDGTTQELEFPLAANARYVNFHYGEILPYPPGGANARQVFFYDGGSFISRGIINGQTPQPIAPLFPSPAGQFLVEAAVGFVNAFPGDTRTIMILGNTAGPNFQSYLTMSADGTNYGPVVPAPFNFKRAPAFLKQRPDKPGILSLVTRVSTATQLTDPNFLGSMCEMQINAEQFFNSYGTAGYGLWYPILGGDRWLHGQGNIRTDGPDGLVYGVFTNGEQSYFTPSGSINSNQGSPNRQVTFIGLPRASMGQAEVLAQKSFGHGDILNENPVFDLWSKGKSRKLPALGRVGPDGFGAKKIGSTAGCFSEAVPGDDQTNFWRIGRVKDSADTNVINIICALRGIDTKKLNRSAVSLAFDVIAGVNFSEPTGIRVVLRGHSDLVDITGTDGTAPGMVTLNNTAFFMPRKDFFRPYRKAFPVPDGIKQVWAVISWTCVGVALDNDDLTFRDIALVQGPTERNQFTLPIAEVRRRCRRRYWKSYGEDVEPGTANVASVFRGKSVGVAPGAVSIPFAVEEMDKPPVATIYSPVTGLPNRLYCYDEAVPKDRDADVLVGAKGAIVTNRNAIEASGQTFGAELTLDASPWPV